MKIKVFFTCSEANKPELDYEIDLLDSLLYGWFHRGCFEDCEREILIGDCHHEAQKEKACDKGIRKQRRNQTVNARKSS